MKAVEYLMGISKRVQGVVKCFRSGIMPFLALGIDTASLPLSWVAGNGHAEKILLEREQAAPNTAYKNGRTPLSQAVKYGN